jgi:hypothetical protein
VSHQSGTAFVVCAVCGSPLVGSTISSQFPWSAVISISPPIASTASATRSRQAPTVSIAFTAAGSTPVCPTMSGFA